MKATVNFTSPSACERTQLVAAVVAAFHLEVLVFFVFFVNDSMRGVEPMGPFQHRSKHSWQCKNPALQ